MTITSVIIPETESWFDVLFGWTGWITRRLGRHIMFDERSRNYPAILSGKTADLRMNFWERNAAALFQGDLGCCTGCAVVGLINTEPNSRPDYPCNLKDAVDIYSRATKIDKPAASYPPIDSGGSILSSMKAAKSLGHIAEYRWCFGVQDVLRALSHFGPVAVGVNWYSGFDTPNDNGQVIVSGHVRGGHAFELVGIDPYRKLVWAFNSWGKHWGLNGKFSISFDDLDRLLKEDGEAVMIKVV
jgi:hypothetical protein